MRYKARGDRAVVMMVPAKLTGITEKGDHHQIFLECCARDDVSLQFRHEILSWDAGIGSFVSEGLLDKVEA